jgi:DNA-directed RNA polymerase sigma subunit (sigma70/sigma32)
MKFCANDYNLCRDQWEKLIDQYVFSERDRAMLKRRLLDGITFEALAEEFYLSTVQTKKIVYKAIERLSKYVV